MTPEIPQQSTQSETLESILLTHQQALNEITLSLRAQLENVTGKPSIQTGRDPLEARTSEPETTQEDPVTKALETAKKLASQLGKIQDLPLSALAQAIVIRKMLNSIIPLQSAPAEAPAPARPVPKKAKKPTSKLQPAPAPAKPVPKKAKKPAKPKPSAPQPQTDDDDTAEIEKPDYDFATESPYARALECIYEIGKKNRLLQQIIEKILDEYDKDIDGVYYEEMFFCFPIFTKQRIPDFNNYLSSHGIHFSINTIGEDEILSIKFGAKQIEKPQTAMMTAEFQEFRTGGDTRSLRNPKTADTMTMEDCFDKVFVVANSANKGGFGGYCGMEVYIIDSAKLDESSLPKFQEAQRFHAKVLEKDGAVLVQKTFGGAMFAIPKEHLVLKSE